MISPHFSRAEFKCNCGKCDSDTVDAELLAILEGIRTHFDRPVIVSSSHRCAEFNREVGGSRKSQHLYGRAADIVVQGIPAYLVQEFCEQLGVPGLGSYESFTHIDTRSGSARWEG